MAEAGNASATTKTGSASGAGFSAMNIDKYGASPAGTEGSGEVAGGRNQKANATSSATRAPAPIAPVGLPTSFLQRILQHRLLVSFAMWWGVLGAPMALMIFLARFVPPTTSVGVFLGLFFATMAIVPPLWIFVLFWPTARMQRYCYCDRKLSLFHRIAGAMFAGALLYSFGPAIGAMEINEGVALQFVMKESNFVSFSGYTVNQTLMAEIYREPGCIDGPGLFATAAPLVAANVITPGPTRWAAPSCFINLSSESISVITNCYYQYAVDDCKDSARELLTSNYNKELASLESLPTGLGLPLLIGFPMADNKDVGDMSAEIGRVFGVAPPSASQLFDPRASKDDIRDLGEHARTVSDALTITIILVMFLVPFLGFIGTEPCWYERES